MNLLLKDVLKRYGIEIDGECLEQIKIGETVYEIPSALQGFLGLLLERGFRKGPHIFVDQYVEGERFTTTRLPYN